MYRCLAVKILGIALLAATAVAGLSGQQVPVFRAGVDLVNFGVTVTDRKGELVHRPHARRTSRSTKTAASRRSGISPAGEDAGPEHPAPRSTSVCVLDVSESMGDDIRFTQTAAVKFLNTLLDAVDITFVDFDTEVRVARYSQADFARLIERIRAPEDRAG